MKIKLDDHYQNVRGVRLTPGEHEVNDQLGQYLIDNGYAARIEELTLPDPIKMEQEVPAASNYDALNMDQLRDLLAEYDMDEDDVVSDIDAHWQERKAEIIAWLEGHA